MNPQERLKGKLKFISSSVSFALFLEQMVIASNCHGPLAPANMVKASINIYKFDMLYH
jgi:hypothetical protein